LSGSFETREMCNTNFLTVYIICAYQFFEKIGILKIIFLVNDYAHINHLKVWKFDQKSRLFNLWTHFVFWRILTKLRAYKCRWSDRKRCNALTNAFNLVRIDSSALCDSNPLPHVTPRHPDPGVTTTRYVVHVRTCACKRMPP